MLRWRTVLALILVITVVAGGTHLYFQGTQEDGIDDLPRELDPDATPARVARQADPPLPILHDIPNFSLVDQAGHPFDRRDLDGHICLVNFIFTRCRGTCPLQTEQLTEYQRILSKRNDWDRIRLISFSVEPDHDTPSVLTEYATAAEADTDHWFFLTGSREDIWTLCQDGFKLPVIDDPQSVDMPIAHSSQLALVDPWGRVRGYYSVLDVDEVVRLSTDLQRLADEQSSVPSDLFDDAWLTSRREAQVQQVAESPVHHDFQFVDRSHESGIRFQHRIVPEGLKDLTEVHYDHGNGLLAGDVDGDGHLDLFFLSLLGRNELWISEGDGTFHRDERSPSVELGDRVCVSGAFVDIDNDGDVDLYVTTVRHGNALFANDGTGRFSDISDSAGLSHLGHCSSAVFFDYDRDGLLDLFLCNVGVYTGDEVRPEGNYKGLLDAFAGHLKAERNEKSLLYRNLGANKFQDVTAEVGLDEQGWTGDAIASDFDGDGWTDLYTLNMQGDDSLWRNVNGSAFERDSRIRDTPWGAMGVAVFDFDNDTDLDVLVTDMHSDMSHSLPRTSTSAELEKRKSRMIWPEDWLKSAKHSIFGNAFYRNDGSGQFEEISMDIGAETYWPWGVSIGDLNADGFADAFITASMNYPFGYGINSVLLNENGRQFRDAEFVLGVEPRRRLGKPWFELDLDGADRKHALSAVLEGRTTVWGARGSRSSVLLDLDNDGDLDIVTNEMNDRPRVLLSNLADTHAVRFLQVSLVGTRSNRDGLGAIVTVRVDDARYTQLQHGKSGYLSQSRMPLYFGLGTAERVDEIIVTWPTGTVQTVSGPIEVNRNVSIDEPS